MKFTRRTVGYTKRNHKRNENILDKLKIKPVINCTPNYQKKWKEHVKKMNTGRMSKQIVRYQPGRQRSIGRPMQRWEENMRP